MRLGLMDRVRRLTRLRFPGRSPRSAEPGPATPAGYGSQAGTGGVHASMPAQGQAPVGYQADGPESWAASSGRHRAAAGRATGGDGATVSTGGHRPPEPPRSTGGNRPPEPPRSTGGNRPPEPPRPTGGNRPAGPPQATVRAGGARARVRPAPAQEQGIPGPRAAAVSVPDAGARAVARTAAVGRSDAAGVVAPAPRRPVWRAAHASLRARLPFTAPHGRDRPAMGDGRRNCGSIEGLIWRQWDTGRPPPAQVVA